MVNEAWSLSDVIAFADEYKITLTVQDINNITIPASDYSKFEDSVIIHQSLPAGYTILEGVTFKVKINESNKAEENNTEE
jgi:hypothetical protein